MENKELAKQKVETTKRSYRSIAAEHKTSHTTLQNVAKNENWSISHRVSKVSKSQTEKRPRKPAHEKILGPIAIRKISELKNELGKNYSSVDEPLIVVYAKNYERLIELEKEIKNEKGGILAYSPKTKTEYLSPRFTAVLAIQKTLVTYAQQLGLSLASRKRLNITLDEDEGQTTIYDVIASINNSKEDEADGIL